MFVGHVGVGLGLASRVRRRALGPMVGAALLLDALLGVFVLVGWEHVLGREDFASTGYLAFDFPWSHSLVAALVWSVLAAGAASAGWLGLDRSGGAAGLVGLAVFSHFVCDAIEHVRGLPLLTDASPRVGLALWTHMPWAVAVELAMLAGGVVSFLHARPDVPRLRRIALVAVLAVFGLFQLAGLFARGPPPPENALATVFVAQTALLVGLGVWVDR